MYQHKLQSLNKEAACYRSPNNPSCIDLILTNNSRSFLNTETYFTGLSDCQKLVLSAFETTFSKTRNKEMVYRVFKKFDQDMFSQDFPISLSLKTVHGNTSFQEIF